MLAPTVRVSICGYDHVLSCTLRAMFRFETRLGISMHEIGRHDPAKVGRALLWAMAYEQRESTEEMIGRIGAAEFLAAVDQAMLLLVSSCPPAQRRDTAESDDAGRTDWHALWAIGCFDLRLSDEQFWSLTPAMFYALCQRLDAQREHAEYCAGIVAAAVTNSNIDPDKTEPFEPALWMRGATGEEARRRRVAAQAANVSATLRHMAEVMPVKVIQGGVTTND